MTITDTSAYELISAALSATLPDISQENSSIAPRILELILDINDLITVTRLTNEGRLN